MKKINFGLMACLVAVTAQNVSAETKATVAGATSTTTKLANPIRGFNYLVNGVCYTDFYGVRADGTLQYVTTLSSPLSECAGGNNSFTIKSIPAGTRIARPKGAPPLQTR